MRVRKGGQGGKVDKGEKEKRTIKTHEDLVIYQKAFEAIMIIFELSKQFPVEERYSLTDQIRRSSRSVCAKFSVLLLHRTQVVLIRVQLSPPQILPPTKEAQSSFRVVFTSIRLTKTEVSYLK